VVTNGATGYYSNSVYIDGTLLSANVYWQANLKPYFGDANQPDIYTYTILKSSSTPTWNVFASVTQF